MDFPQTTIFVGSNMFQIRDINEARELVEEIRNMADGSHVGMSGALQDFCFAVEVAYQSYHQLDQDNWSVLHLEKGG